MKPWQIIFLLFLIAGTIYVLDSNPPYHQDRGKIFGTYYSITYQHDKELEDEIKKTLRQVDNSLSPFNKKSVITAINENRYVVPDTLFVQVFTLAQQISQHTNGAFDITVAPLVNAWGFGFKNSESIDSMTIDSLRRFVDYKSICLNDGKIMKQHPQTQLDCSAIAKGFGCDRVARLLDSHNIDNYLVEIGGEIVAKGKNDKSKRWSIGINKPIEDATGSNTELQEIIHITNKSMATSGNYRNFRYENGRKVSHTIDPRTGYPVQHSLLSATVIADDCATADAYATAFMVLGLEESMQLCHTHNIDAYFIYSEPDGNIKTTETEGMKKYH